MKNYSNESISNNVVLNQKSAPDESREAENLGPCISMYLFVFPYGKEHERKAIITVSIKSRRLVHAIDMNLYTWNHKVHHSNTDSFVDIFGNIDENET